MSDYERYWILGDDHSLIPTSDISVWGRFLDNRERCTVGKTTVGDYQVSTMFFGMDMGYGDEGAPILFETMVFSSDPEWDKLTDRYATWDEAEAGHAAMVQRVKQAAEARAATEVN